MEKALTALWFTVCIVFLSIQIMGCTAPGGPVVKTVISESSKFSLAVTEPDNFHIMTASLSMVEEIDPLTYDHAVLFRDGTEIGWYDKDYKCVPDFELFDGGALNFEFVLYDNANEEIRRLTDTVIYDIESTFVFAATGWNTPSGAHLVPGVDSWVVAQSLSLMSLDSIYVLKIRLAKNEELTLSVIAERVADSSLNYGGQVAEIHFRGYDYRDRAERLYPDNLDECVKHVDPETDKWISAPYDISTGVHEVYVCPSVPHDKSKVTIRTQGVIQGGLCAYSKSGVY